MPLKPKILAGLAISLVAGLLLSELGLRLRFGFGSPLLYSPDPCVGYVPAANQDLRRFGATIRINEYGMRSDRLADTPAPLGTGVRLLFVGDSVTFGTTYVDQSKIFTELIRSALRTRLHSPVEVLNASAGGWAPENEYQYLHSRGTFGAHMVIFVINTNDLDQPFATFEPSPQFPTDKPKTAIGELWTRYLEPRIDSSIRTTDPGSDPETVPNPGRARAVLQTLERAKDFSNDQGAQFVIIFSPADYAYEKSPLWVATVQTLRSWSDRNNVKLIDMSSVYAHYSSAQLYLDGIHLTPLGHELVAGEFISRFASLAIHADSPE